MNQKKSLTFSQLTNPEFYFGSKKTLELVQNLSLDQQTSNKLLLIMCFLNNLVFKKWLDSEGFDGVLLNANHFKLEESFLKGSPMPKFYGKSFLKGSFCFSQLVLL